MRGQVQGWTVALPQTLWPPADRRGLTHLGVSVERGKPVALLRRKVSRKASPWDCGYGIAEEAKVGLEWAG